MTRGHYIVLAANLQKNAGGILRINRRLARAADQNAARVTVREPSNSVIERSRLRFLIGSDVLPDVRGHLAHDSIISNPPIVQCERMRQVKGRHRLKKLGEEGGISESLTAYHVVLAVQTLRARSACSASRADARVWTAVRSVMEGTRAIPPKSKERSCRMTTSNNSGYLMNRASRDRPSMRKS